MPISAKNRAFVRQRANYCCEYCKTGERISGIAAEIDHIVPLANNGNSEPENLCLVCSHCNGRKWTKTTGIDPQTKEPTLLFNPRQQIWTEHFAWSDDEYHIVGLTAIGRATISTLQMNHNLIVAARRLWSQFGLHPPD